MIKIDRKCSCRVFRAGTRDIDVEAEGVVLRAIKCTSTVAGDDFVAEDVVSCRSSLVLTTWLTARVVQGEGKL
jgi:hypothetical protein